MFMTFLKLCGLLLLSAAVFDVFWHFSPVAFWVGVVTMVLSVLWIVRSTKRGR